MADLSMESRQKLIRTYEHILSEGTFGPGLTEMVELTIQFLKHDGDPEHYAFLERVGADHPPNVYSQRCRLCQDGTPH